MIKRARRKTLLIILFALLIGYMGSYLILTLGGRYEPAAIGLNGVKWYHWAPRGFVTDFRWNGTMRRAYYPLWRLDTMLWHTSDEARSGRYPVNFVPASEIGIIYEAWED